MSLASSLTSFRTLFGALAAAVAAGPLALVASEWIPPWPSGSGRAVVSIASIVSVIFLAYALASSPSKPAARLRAKLGLASGGVLLLAYLVLFAAFVRDTIQVQDGKPVHIRIASGWSLNPGIEDKGSAQENVKEYGVPDRIWSAASLVTVRLALLVSFCLSFGLLAFGLMSLQQSRPQGRTDPVPAGEERSS